MATPINLNQYMALVGYNTPIVVIDWKSDTEIYRIEHHAPQAFDIHTQEAGVVCFGIVEDKVFNKPTLYVWVK